MHHRQWRWKRGWISRRRFTDVGRVHSPRGGIDRKPSSTASSHQPCKFSLFLLSSLSLAYEQWIREYRSFTGYFLAFKETLFAFFFMNGRVEKSFEKFGLYYLSVSVLFICYFCSYLGDQLRWAFAFLVACHCALYWFLVLFTYMFCTVGLNKLKTDR